MRAQNGFGALHPLVTFAFFIVAIVFGMTLRAPAFLCAGVGFSALYYLTIKGRAAWPVFGGMVIVFIGITVINPFFNPLGDTVLFTYFGGRPYTLEALYFGMATGAMLVAMLLWFSSYNAVMTSDKFTYLFGSVAPSLTMVLTMVLRFVPNYQQKIDQFATARASIGKAVSEGGVRDRATNALAIVSILTTWAFENAIVTADSMRSRGYGAGRRTNYALYRFTGRDGVTLGVIAGLTAVVVVCALAGATAAEYTPSVVLAPLDAAFWVGIAAYGALLALPTLINGGEALTWTILRSRI